MFVALGRGCLLDKLIPPIHFAAMFSPLIFGQFPSINNTYFKACTKGTQNIGKYVSTGARKWLQDGGNTLVADVKFQGEKQSLAVWINYLNQL